MMLLLLLLVGGWAGDGQWIWAIRLQAAGGGGLTHSLTKDADLIVANRSRLR